MGNIIYIGLKQLHNYYELNTTKSEGEGTVNERYVILCILGGKMATA